MGRCRRRFTLSLSLLYYHYYYHYYYQLSIINYQLSVINYQLSIIKFYHIRLVDGPTEIRLRSRSLALFCAVRCGAVRCAPLGDSGTRAERGEGEAENVVRQPIFTYRHEVESVGGREARGSKRRHRSGRDERIRVDTDGYWRILADTGGERRTLPAVGLQANEKPMRGAEGVCVRIDAD